MFLCQNVQKLFRHNLMIIRTHHTRVSFLMRHFPLPSDPGPTTAGICSPSPHWWLRGETGIVGPHLLPSGQHHPYLCQWPCHLSHQWGSTCFFLFLSICRKNTWNSIYNYVLIYAGLHILAFTQCIRGAELIIFIVKYQHSRGNVWLTESASADTVAIRNFPPFFEVYY